MIVDQVRVRFTALYFDDKSDDEVEKFTKTYDISPETLDDAIHGCIEELQHEGPWLIGLEYEQLDGSISVTESDLRKQPALKCLIEEAANAQTSPSATLDFVTLSGYLGPGDVEGRMRLYADADLENYTSLRAEDTNLRHRFQTEHAPFDSVDVVWLRRNVPVGRDRRQPRGDKAAGFLEGELMEAADVAAALPTSIAGSTSDEPFCVSYTCCKRTSRCPPGRRGRGD